MKAFGKYLLRHFWMGFALAYLGMALIPASIWYAPGTLAIPDSVEGEPVELLYQGGAVRDFTGRYTVVSRDLRTSEIVCEAVSGYFPYEVDSVRPEPLYMDWWAPSDPRCNALPAGTFSTQTCWTVSGVLGGLAPPKHICGEAVTHTVHPRD